MSDSYRCAKSLRRQFERTWRRSKNPLNRSQLHRQIARCNSLVNKDKSNYYSKLISDNSQDPKKLACTAKTLGRVSGMTLPPHDSDKALANQFASYFHNKIKIIRDTFIPSGIKIDVHPSSDPPKITIFTQVTQDIVDKIIRNLVLLFPIFVNSCLVCPKALCWVLCYFLSIQSPIIWLLVNTKE